MIPVFSAAADAHEKPGHVERPARVRAAERALQGRAQLLEPAPAREEDALLVHSPEHLARLRAAAASGRALDADTFTTRASFDAALRSAGAALAAAREGGGFALARPPGHHAGRDGAMGFCLLNNVAIAAERLAREGKRVAIVDIDVHHGNGTAEIFRGRSDVLVVSTHGDPLWPGTGAVEDATPTLLNLPLPAGTDHEGYLEVLDRAVVPMVARFRPDAILVSVGFDAHHRDPLGNLALVDATFHAAILRLRAVQPRTSAVLEGGYDLEAMARGSVAVAAALAGDPLADAETPLVGRRPWAQIEPRVRAAHPGLLG